MNRRLSGALRNECTSDAMSIVAIRDVTELTTAAFNFFYSIASPKRKKRTDAFLHRDDAARSLVGEALVYLIVWMRTGKVLDPTSIEENEFGRPFIRGGPFSFNVTHSGCWVVCAVDRGEVGVDVEKITSVDLGIADRFFTPGEAALIRGCITEYERNTMFFRLWVCKESYIKALGRGLSCPLNSFECIYVAGDNPIRLRLLDTTLPKRFLRFVPLPDKEYACALCTMHPATRSRLMVWSSEELFQQLKHL